MTFVLLLMFGYCSERNYFSAMTADDWILAEKSSRTFCSPRWFGAMRRHLCVKNCFGDGT